MFGCDTYSSLQSNLLGTNYSFHNPTDKIRLRGEIVSRIHENVINIIINNTEKINFRRNLHRKEKTVKAGERVLLENHQQLNKLSSTIAQTLTPSLHAKWSNSDDRCMQNVYIP